MGLCASESGAMQFNSGHCWRTATLITTGQKDAMSIEDGDHVRRRRARGQARAPQTWDDCDNGLTRLPSSMLDSDITTLWSIGMRTATHTSRRPLLLWQLCRTGLRRRWARTGENSGSGAGKGPPTKRRSAKSQWSAYALKLRWSQHPVGDGAGARETRHPRRCG